MLVLKRHYQFWLSILALHKLGAVAIPATSLLVRHDYEYRFEAAQVKAIVCTGDGECAAEVDLAQESSPTLQIKIIANGSRPGWHSFDEEMPSFPDTLERVPTSRDDPAIMARPATPRSLRTRPPTRSAISLPRAGGITSSRTDCT